MGRAIDATGIQFKLLDRSRVPRSGLRGAGRQAPIRRVGQVGARGASRTSSGSSDGRADPCGGGRVTGLELEAGDRSPLPIARGHNRHVPQRPDPRRPRAATAPGRAGEPPSARSRRVAQVVRFRVGAPEDRNAPSTSIAKHRLLAIPAELGDDPPVPFSFETDSIDRTQINSVLDKTAARGHGRARPGIA